MNSAEEALIVAGLTAYCTKYDTIYRMHSPFFCVLRLDDLP